MNKEKLKVAFIKHRSYLTKGMAEQYAIKTLVVFVTAIGLSFKYLLEINLQSWIYTIIGVLCLIECWFIGWLWDKSHMYETEAEFGNTRNPTMRYLKKQARGKV